MSAYITSLATANPKYKVSQREVLTFMTRAHGLSDKKAQDLEVLYRATGIHSRYSVIEDYKRGEGFKFYPDNEKLEPFPDTKKRSAIYKQEAIELSCMAAESCLKNLSNFDRKSITHLITVSCTGLYAPGLDIDLVQRLGLNTKTQRTGVNFMGCYAAINALKLAKSLCQSENANVLVICCELCSIHFQKSPTDDNLLSNALFGDGAAAILVQPEPGENLNLSLKSFSCDLLLEGGKEMAWQVGNFGFEMKLSSYVPDIIKSGIGQLLQSIEEKDFAFYAIHPGGKKILAAIESNLGISREDNHLSHEILKNYGNMSSPTLLFVIEAIYAGLSAADRKKKILCLAFGPGLTLESMVLSVN